MSTIIKAGAPNSRRRKSREALGIIISAANKQHGPQAEQPVHKNRDHRLRFLVVRFARGVEGLDDVAAGGTEQEGVEELGDEGNAGGAAPRQIKALHLEHQAPAGHAQQYCQ